jgi:hypothetical protein
VRETPGVWVPRGFLFGLGLAVVISGCDAPHAVQVAAFDAFCYVFFVVVGLAVLAHLLVHVVGSLQE